MASDSRIEKPAQQDRESAGLLAPSTVRTGRLQTIEASLLEGQLGSLDAADLEAIDAALREVLQLD